MKSLLAPAVVLVTGVAALAPAAHAGTYVGAGIGTSASVDGAISDYGTDGKHSGRLYIGQRFGVVSVEGGFNDYGLTTSRGTVSWNAFAIGAAAKLDLPVTPLIHGYVRLGLEHTWISSDAAGAKALDGNGWTGALGGEYRLDAILPNASVWLDYSRHTVNVTRGNTVDAQGTANMWTLGVTIGI
jgi:Outer membrane protein beta-barrel domain